MSQKALKIPRTISTSLSHTSTIPPICLRCTYASRLIQARYFTSSQSKYGAMGQMQKAPAPKQPSMKAKIAHMEKSQLGDDIGRIPNTLILPAFDDYPRDLKMIAKLLWRKFSDTVVGMATLIYATKWDVPKDKRTGRSKRQPLEMSSRLSVATLLHRKMNENLAAGNTRVLNLVCASGLSKHCKDLINSAKDRGHGQRDWVLVRYEGINYPEWLRNLWPLMPLLPNAAVRVVSDRVIAIPFGKQSYLRECIVRIKSIQAMRIHVAGKPSIRQERHTEYVVMQKMNINGEPGDWKIWGTIDPSTKELEDILTGKAGGVAPNSFLQEFKSRMSTMSGMNF